MVNVWTIDDLPSHASITDADNEHGNGMRSVVISIALGEVVAHLNEHHPKPARPVTRDDLPYLESIIDATSGQRAGSFGYVEAILAAVVAHLNANGGLPADDRWRRAHAIVEQERDQARESLRRLRDEKDFDLFTVRDQLKQCRGERKEMTRQRDEWKARAEADPVETKAEELFKIANPTLEWAWASVPNEEAYRRMAAHVLEKEDRHVDQ